MSLLSSQHIATFRDERARTVTNGTVNRDLALLSHAIQTARREWGIYLPDNPVHLVRKLREPLPRSRRLAPEERIDLNNSVLLLPDTKNGSPPAVPLSNVAKAIIGKYLARIPHAPDGKLFAGVTSEAVKLSFQRAVVRAGLVDFRFHDLRHEATSRLHEKGLNPIKVMSVTGHKSMSSMLRYSHVRGLAVTEKLNNPIGYQPAPLQAAAAEDSHDIR
jgi:hypothetical protein